MAAILQNLYHLGPNFALHSRTTQDMCVQNIIGISAKLRALARSQRFSYTFRILRRRRRLQTNRTHIGPHIHVGPNKVNQNILLQTLICCLQMNIQSFSCMKIVNACTYSEISFSYHRQKVAQ